MRNSIPNTAGKWVANGAGMREGLGLYVVIKQTTIQILKLTTPLFSVSLVWPFSASSCVSCLAIFSFLYGHIHCHVSQD